MQKILSESSLYFIAVILKGSGFMLIGCLVGALIEEFSSGRDHPQADTEQAHCRYF